MPSFTILTFYHGICIISFAGASASTMMEIIRFPLKDSKVTLAQEIGTKYFEFGTFLVEDATGACIKALKKELRDNTEDINREIFQKWLSGGGKTPVS